MTDAEQRVADVEARAEALIEYICSFGYRKRRQFLWRRVQPPLARFLYKFRSFRADETSVDRVRDILVRSRLWLSSPREFNDPFDMSPQMTVAGTPAEIRERLDGVLKSKGIKWNQRQVAITRIMSADDVEVRVHNSFAAIVYRTGVCSFAGDPRSILMWSHYADNHEGLCLQLETARDVRRLAYAFEVRYSTDYPTFNWVK